MRGIDLRADCGICLFVAQSFESKRAFEQGLARVGRFGDKCERFILPDVSEVDLESNLKLASSLTSFEIKQENIKKIALVAP